MKRLLVIAAFILAAYAVNAWAHRILDSTVKNLIPLDETASVSAK